MRTAATVAIALVLAAPAGAARQSPGSLPSSTLPLRLVGVIRDTAMPARSAGLIQCIDSQQKRSAWLYVVGDRACDVAELREILKEAVVIRNLLTGRLEILTLPEAGAPPPLLPRPSPNDEPVDREPDMPAPVVHAVSPNVVNVELQKEMLHRYLSNLGEVLTAALATPRYATGGSGPPAIEGYEMSRIKPGGIVDQLGLRDGDVLLAFNGRKLDSLAAVTGLLSQVEVLSGSTMTVLRDGTRVTFHFTVK